MGLKSFVFVSAAFLTINAQAITKVACVGNSITEGYGLNWNDKKYPDHLQEFLGSEYQVQNFGNSGKMFHKASSESYWKQETFTKAYDFAPDIVVIELGTNDSKYFHDGAGSSTGFNYYPQDISKEELQKDYEALIDTFAHQTQAPKVFATLQPYANNWDWFITDTAIVNQINPIIKAAATAKGIPLIDLHEQFNKPEWLLSDNVHPNATGAKELARIIASAIENKGNIPAMESSSSSETESSSSESTTIIQGHSTVAKAGIHIQKDIISIENYVGKVQVFDLNGTQVKQVQINGTSSLRIEHAGAFIVKAGTVTKKIRLDRHN
ncbi:MULTISPECIES: GDSL-type esterase/lipase family protein [unclassified Fibrobacter]|uniref:GDSL-type esterase/lipase family protein n=1 Tax=unclassified Fibrobacter TaxID=2634177 RepID=UPI000D6C0EE5|nr:MULTISPECIES: GDSL-type esterase/lipase family protein [unclassified Fibrobacter]PWJ62506.1 lysophospholipase L1-like esterase [Fibrobacter sp. UWR4]PZW67367.1 lysophospholipase L1-like esterase [Fibrobacter sp. UWR1]